MIILVDKDTVIPAGPYNLQFSEAYDGNKAIIMSPPFSNPPVESPPSISLINYADLQFIAPTTVYWTIELISVATQSFWAGSKIENHGTMYVSALGGGAFAIRANSWSPGLINTGTITVESKSQSIGFESWGYYPGNTGPLVDNSGAFFTRSEGSDFTLYLANGGAVVNSGLIYAYSEGQGSGAYAISLPNGKGTITNTGQIIAEAGVANQATAISFFASGEVHITNSGTIRGDYAINEHNNDNPPESATSSVNNSGTITGRIYLGDGDDVLVNSGTIDGLIELGYENDTYNGVGGHTVQAVMGGYGDDLLFAGTGAESFFGEAGDDVFGSGTGAATFDGGAGFDAVDYSSNSTGVTISLGLSTAQSIGGSASTTLISIEGLGGTALADVLTGDGSANLLYGAAGDDRLVGLGGGDLLIGAEGADQLDGGDGGDMLSGDQGADTLAGGAGSDVFLFLKGDGQDVITDFNTAEDKIDLSDKDGYSTIRALVQDGSDVVVQLSDTDSIRVKNTQIAALQPRILLLDPTPKTLVGDGLANHLTGGVGNDSLSGLGGDDVLDGGRGDDLLNGGLGRNTLNGGDGVDTITYVDAPNGVNVDLTEGAAYGNVLNDVISSVEQVIGSAYQDVLEGSSKADHFWGGGGDDGLYGNDGDDVMYGEAGADTFYGGEGSDQMFGGAWLDVFVFYSGADSREATPDVLADFTHGYDRISIRSTTIDQMARIDFVGTGSEVYFDLDPGLVHGKILVADHIDATDFTEVDSVTRFMITGGPGDDYIRGATRNDILDGGEGNDILAGGQNDDIYIVDSTADQIVEGLDGGWDTVYASASYTLANYIESLFLQGAAASGTGNAKGNAMYGGEGNNYLNGAAGDDYLSAGGGADILDGGTGGDILDGGSGDDSYGVDSVFDSIREAVNG
ncbi:MAG TPA: M10 family metallopeptidase C-terminal domain-containing protein, partial [Caulobacter sp.]|nr:M10 family metallopeptidase C-terminal domain-containing protein [Caulobacter sp.]